MNDTDLSKSSTEVATMTKPVFLRVYRLSPNNTTYQPQTIRGDPRALKDLAPEIRTMIYNYTLPEPHHLIFSRIKYTVDDNKEIKVYNYNADGGQRAQSQTPSKDTNAKPSDTATNLPWALLAVNKEARAHAQKVYKLVFQHKVGGICGLYIDFSRDMLCFHSVDSPVWFFTVPCTSKHYKDHKANIEETSKAPRQLALYESLDDDGCRFEFTRGLQWFAIDKVALLHAGWARNREQNRKSDVYVQDWKVEKENMEAGREL